ncbi:DUF218 domain-containing protein [Caloramator fervidus]|uniref:DUF218 domain-containing protein n=2 Tax=Caloramator fervidus TaxID=29344 RepID=A0A1H5TD20_9CLOT|nr:YdcF family protein [Caloramator fervidus]SEF59907.1 DUF218 domain-containing protein [Caloramator fervidus]
MKKCLILFLFIMFSFILFEILYFGYTAKPKKADCMIILGCKVRGYEPGDFLKSRLDVALRLYKEGYCKFIIVSGGKGKNELISEAEAMKIYLIKNGVSEKYIIKEDKSFSTYENLFNSLNVMKNKGFKDALIVSNKYHLKRASLMAKKIGIKASFQGCIVKEKFYLEVIGILREVFAILKFYILGL